MTPLQKLQTVSKRMYSEIPTSMLFHYTSIYGLMGIVDAKALWASEVRYLNDAQELHYFGQLVDREILTGPPGWPINSAEAEILRQFTIWLKERLSLGPLIFVGSLTENGNLLSQWRGYCPHGEGVSLGFNPLELVCAAKGNEFTFGRCIYDIKLQAKIVVEVIDIILDGAKTLGPASPNTKHPTQSYHGIFEKLDGEILRMAALLKHPAFSEEREWRAVSPAFSNYVTAPIRHRAGKSMLVPYTNLPLPTQHNRLDVPVVFVGPTPTPDLSINSISQYLSKNASSSQRQVAACCIPYRP